MTHLMRDMETHRKNTWLFDEWGLLGNMGNTVTMSDVDGFVAYYLRRSWAYLMIEMKHWDGTGEVPHMDLKSGQARGLKNLSSMPNFTVIIGYGDTSTKTIHYCEVWYKGNTHVMKWEEALSTWYGWVTRNER